MHELHKELPLRSLHLVILVDMRRFKVFRYKDASYRISLGSNEKKTSSQMESEGIYQLLTDNIRTVRTDIENYIVRQPEFLTSLEPVKLLKEAPDAVMKMGDAAWHTGRGPMAAVAGTIAQYSAELTAGPAAIAGYDEIIIENGGDIYISRPQPGQADNHGTAVVAGIFSGLESAFSSLALRIEPDDLPLSICSSSSRMGHSLSLGDCDLSTVISKDAALADAAATLGGNIVRSETDLFPSAERIAAIDGIIGVILIKNSRIAMAGKLPQLIRHTDAAGLDKITMTTTRKEC